MTGHLSLEQIMDVYEKSRHWYGDASFEGFTTTRVSGLKDALEGIDLVLLDSYGVLCRGSDVIPEALTAIEYLRKNNMRFSIVSNDTMNGQATVEEKYKNLGFDFSKQEIVTSLDVVEAYIKNLLLKPKMAVTGLKDNPLKEVFYADQNLNASQGNLDNEIQTLMYLVGKGWNAEMQNNLCKSAGNIQQVILGNPDVGAPVEDVFVPTPGLYMHHFYETTKHASMPLLLGKPAQAIFKHTLNKIAYQGDPAKVLMVGDSLHTDILGGHMMGFKTLLLESGIFRKGGAETYIKKTGITPTYIATTI